MSLPPDSRPIKWHDTAVVFLAPLSMIFNVVTLVIYPQAASLLMIVPMVVVAVAWPSAWSDYWRRRAEWREWRREHGID